MMDDFLKATSTVGFPIVAFWLMYRLYDRTLEAINRNTGALHELTVAIRQFESRQT